MALAVVAVSLIEILLKDGSGWSHHKRHHAACGILRWIGNEGEAARHLAVFSYVFATGCM